MKWDFKKIKIYIYVCMYKRRLTDLTPMNPRIGLERNMRSIVCKRPSIDPTSNEVDADGMCLLPSLELLISVKDFYNILLVFR